MYDANIERGEGIAKFWPKEGRLREFGTDRGVKYPDNVTDGICERP